MPSRRNARGWATLGLALLLGAITVAGFAPLHCWWLPPLTLAGLMLLWRDATPKRAAALGFFFGLGWFCAGISWVYVSMHYVGGMPAIIAGLATLLFSAYLALFPALAGWLQARLRGAFAAANSSAYLHALLVVPAAWAFSEWLRGWLFTGFPWVALGYAHTDGPYAGYAPLVGIVGLDYLCAFAAAMIALAMHPLLARVAIRSALLPLGTLAVSVAVGAGLKQVEWTPVSGAPFNVALYQGNVPQELKFVEGRFEATLFNYRRMLATQPAELMVLPETALPRMLNEIPRDYLRDLALFADEKKANIIVGVPRNEGGGRYFNSAISLGVDPVQSYDKAHLVPFGEFIPFGFRWFVAMMNIPLGDFTRGAAKPATMQLSGRQVALNICYEDLFGEEIIRQLPQANVLVNISNIAWFGDSLAPHQHLQISRMRALETGRPMLRATNTGATAVIDEKGNVTAALPYFTDAVLTAQVQARSGATPYVRTGNWPMVTLCMLVLAGALWRRRRVRPGQRRA